MFEHRKQPLLNNLAFIWRLFRAFLITVLIVGLSILAGTLGFHWFVDLSWSDSFHRTCLVLGEHTLHKTPEATSGKIFVGLYVMYSRLVFFAIIVILVMPLLHRVFHKLHLDCLDSVEDPVDKGL